MGRELCRCQLLTVSASGSISPDLFVITHPAALVSNSRYKRFLRNRFGRSWLWVTILYCGDASFWGVLKSVVDFLHKHISNDGVGIPPDQRWVWVCRHLPIGQGIAEDVEVTVVEPPIVFVVKFVQGGSLVGLERRCGPLKHRFRFRRRS